MKKVAFLFLTAFALMLNYSCTQDVDVNVFPNYVTPGTTNSNGQYAIAFSNYQNGQSTRALVESNSNTGYDDFSLYAWTESGTIMNPYHTKWVGEGWTYVGVDNQELQYFDNFIDEYNFISIIPQQTNNSINNGKVTVATESFLVDNETMTDTPKEFLYATLTVPKAKYSEGLTVNFKHGNAKIYFKFTSDDPNTQIIDYAPYTPGSPAQDAWDETVEVTTYQTTVTTVPALGPLVTSVEISDEDMAYVNSKYSASKGFSNYSSSNVINGNLDENMWEYLVNKYPTLNSINLENWDSNATNTNMRLVHIDKTGHKSVDNDSYRGVWVNVQNVNWNNPTTTQQTIHHDAVPAVIESGKEGVVVLPATSAIGNGSDAVLATYPTKATAEVSLDGINWNTTETNSILTFSKPTTKIVSDDIHAAIPSPTTWYALPCNDENVGYTVKVSYNYKGVNVYDARVFIPANEAQWEEGKYYTYIIQLNGKGNGHVEPNDVNAEDPTVNEAIKHEIKLFKVEFTEYGYGTTIIKEIK